MAGYSNGSEVGVGAKASVIGTNVASDSDRDRVPAVSHSAQMDAGSASGLSRPFLPLWGSIQDASVRGIGSSPLVSSALTRVEVLGQPLAADVFQISDSIYLADPRIKELRTATFSHDPN
jgi:hypothetical protein